MFRESGFLGELPRELLSQYRDPTASSKLQLLKSKIKENFSVSLHLVPVTVNYQPLHVSKDCHHFNCSYILYLNHFRIFAFVVLGASVLIQCTCGL